MLTHHRVEYALRITDTDVDVRIMKYDGSYDTTINVKVDIEDNPEDYPTIQKVELLKRTITITTSDWECID